MELEGELPKRLLDPAVGRVLGAEPALLHHDETLGLQHVVVEDEVRHPVRFHIHHPLEQARHEVLVVDRIVARGERVHLGALGLELLEELLGSVLGGSLEHQMLEEMRETGTAGLLVDRTDLEPGLIGDDRNGVVLDHDDLEAIGERALVELEVHAEARGERPAAFPAGA